MKIIFNKIKNKNGITLIALVVTIIILIILSGVIINIALGEKGIINRAKKAKNDMEYSTAREGLEIELTSAKTHVEATEGRQTNIRDCNLLANKKNVEKIEYITEEASTIIIEIDNPKYALITYKSYEFKVNSKLEIVSENGKVNIANEKVKIENNESLLGAIARADKTEYKEFNVNGQKYKTNIIVNNGNLTLDGSVIEGATYSNNVYEFGNSETDVATETQDAQNMVVLKVKGDLVINNGIILTACKSENGYGGPKGLLVYCTGKIVNNGTISMTARGARAVGQNVYLYKNANGSYEFVPATGGVGADGAFTTRTANYADYKYYGKNGASGFNRATGGGGSGGGYTWNQDLIGTGAGNGAAGTSYSGGTGGGASNGYGGNGNSKGQNGSENGANGGDSGLEKWSGYSISGGAGNKTGKNYTGVQDTNITGTGGLLIIYSKIIEGTGKIESDGSAATENWCASGGGSGAGSINIFTNSISEEMAITADGKTTTTAAGIGGKGGNGSITKCKIVNGNCVNYMTGNGTGTKDNPYIIENRQALKDFAREVNSGNTYEGKYIKLNNDINLDSSKQWIPIGDTDNYFEGTFDGNNKTIDGLYIENSLEYQALFSVVGTKGTVENLNVKGRVISGGCCAGIVGLNYGIVKNCVNYANVTCSGYGVAGVATDNNGIVYRCINKGTISCSIESAAGIAAYNGNSRDSGKTVSGFVIECINEGSIYSASWDVRRNSCN